MRRADHHHVAIGRDREPEARAVAPSDAVRLLLLHPARAVPPEHYRRPCEEALILIARRSNHDDVAGHRNSASEEVVPGTVVGGEHLLDRPGRPVPPIHESLSGTGARVSRTAKGRRAPRSPRRRPTPRSQHRTHPMDAAPARRAHADSSSSIRSTRMRTGAGPGGAEGTPGRADEHPVASRQCHGRAEVETRALKKGGNNFCSMIQLDRSHARRRRRPLPCPSWRLAVRRRHRRSRRAQRRRPTNSSVQ